jgi:5-methyltetrahydropteroyltriglutamate--homocysteine methyltransferase
VLDLSTEEVESVEIIKQRVRRALDHVNPDRILLAPDCGMKYLSRDSAFGKLSNMAAAAAQLRDEFQPGD